MPLSKGFRLNSATAPIDFRLAQQGYLTRTSGGAPRAGILHSGTADGNVITRSASSLAVTLLDQVVLALARNVTGTDGVDIVTNVGALVQNLSAPTANSWYATLWARQNDSTGAGGAADPDSLPTFGVTYGGAAASPAIPAAPTGATKIGHILIPSGAASAQSSGVVYTETIPHTSVVGGRIRYRSITEMNGDIANLADGAVGFVRSGDLYFLKGGAWISLSDDTGWIIPVSLGAGWSNGNTPFQYRRKNGVVYFAGELRGAPSGRVTALTLPVGFRPSGTVIQPIGVAAWTADVQVDAGGTLGVQASVGRPSGTGYTLGGFSYPAV